MGRPTFKAYVDSIQAKSDKTPDEFWKLANEKGFVKKGKLVAKHGVILKWLKSDFGLGHVHASFMTVYLRLRSNDPQVSAAMRSWADSTGYEE